MSRWSKMTREQKDRDNLMHAEALTVRRYNDTTKKKEARRAYWRQQNRKRRAAGKATGRRLEGGLAGASAQIPRTHSTSISLGARRQDHCGEPSQPA